MNCGSFYIYIKYIPQFLLMNCLKLSFVIIITALIHIIRLYLGRYLLYVKNVKPVFHGLNGFANPDRVQG